MSVALPTELEAIDQALFHPLRDFFVGKEGKPPEYKPTPTKLGDYIERAGLDDITTQFEDIGRLRGLMLEILVKSGFAEFSENYGNVFPQTRFLPHRTRTIAPGGIIYWTTPWGNILFDERSALGVILEIDDLREYREVAVMVEDTFGRDTGYRKNAFILNKRRCVQRLYNPKSPDSMIVYSFKVRPVQDRGETPGLRYNPSDPLFRRLVIPDYGAMVTYVARSLLRGGEKR